MENPMVVLDVKDNRDINLAVGTSRHETNWKNQTMRWSEFLGKLQRPTVTQESAAEYSKLTKAKRDNIKDVGGFVGGFLKQGRRKIGHVQSRSIVTLDADSGHPAMWEDMQLLSTFATAVYTTHSHTAKTPRYRFIIPLRRPVTVEEYEPLARKIASLFGMDYFDDTTYQPERLMYWPSHSFDGEYLFDYQDDVWCDPDEILNTYVDWKDSSSWPESSRGHNIRDRAAKKQGDPTAKPGVIGAFCRSFSIKEAIGEYLEEVYSETRHPDRFTYLDGSTSGGLVLYDDKFAYSHHGTDPVGDTLVNAFDLVRIHKFGDLDEDVAPTTANTKRPSFMAMREFAMSLPAVKGLMAREKIQGAMDDFDEWVEDSDDKDWLSQLELDSYGTIESSAPNLELIFGNDQNLKGKIYLDLFAHRMTIKKDLPWREMDGRKFWEDADDAGLRIYLEKTYGIVNRGKIEDALMQEIEKNGFNPVKNYLDGLEWDKVPRIETLLVDYQGAIDSKYVRMVTRKFMAAAVARIYVPGIKFDHMLVTTGAQGLGKTFLPNMLAGDWFSNSIDGVKGKDAYDSLQGAWIMEMGEMQATKKADIETLKHFITKTEDIYRVSYGRHKSYFKRQCVFWGTSNDDEFLRDKTGNRRFWPVSVGKVKSKLSPFTIKDEDRDQLWAEAKYIWEQGEPIWLNRAEEDLAGEYQAMHVESSAIEGEIQEFLEIPITDDWYTRSKQSRREYIQGVADEMEAIGEVVRESISVAEIWNELYGRDTSNMHPAKAAEIRTFLANMAGWTKSFNAKGQISLGPGYGRQVSYVRDIDLSK